MHVTKVCRQLTGVEALYARDMWLTPWGLVVGSPTVAQAALWRLLAVRAELRPYAANAIDRGPWHTRTARWLAVEQVLWARHDRVFTLGPEQLVA